jgi:hypothetical protein
MALRLSVALMVGSAVTSLPWLASKINAEVLWPTAFLWTPGTMVALVLSGNVHDYSMTVLVAVNVIFYASVTYLFLHVKNHRPVSNSTQM